MTRAKLRQLVTSRPFITGAVGLVLAGLGQAGIHTSPSLRGVVANVLTVALPAALAVNPAAVWSAIRARLGHPTEDGTPGASGVTD